MSTALRDGQTKTSRIVVVRKEIQAELAELVRLWRIKQVLSKLLGLLFSTQAFACIKGVCRVCEIMTTNLRNTKEINMGNCAALR